MGVQRLSGSDAGKVEAGSNIDARCIVEFRPIVHNNGSGYEWRGQYGFDWFRIGDCEESGHLTHYVDEHLVGIYTDQHDNRYVNGNTTDPDNPDYDNRRYFKYNANINGTTKNDYFADKLARYYTYKEITGLGLKIRNYIVPWICMGEPRSLVKIKMIVKSDSTNIENVGKIRIVSPGNYIVFGLGNKKKELSGKVIFNYIDIVGPFAKRQEIEVELLYMKQVPDNHSIKAYAYYNEAYLNYNGFDKKYHTLAGLLNVVDYYPLTVDVWFIPVFTQTDDVCSNPSIGDGRQNDGQGTNLNEQKENLRKFLAQTLVVPNFKDEEINGQNGNVYICFNSTSFVVNDGSRSGLHRRDYRLLQALLTEFRRKYGDDNAYKIFFINKKGFNTNNMGQLYEIKGHANDFANSEKSAVIFENPKRSTVCHELLHCFGLYHSFSNNNYNNIGNNDGFTFEKCKTSNIMDYQSSIDRISLWRWQWEKIRKEIERRQNQHGRF